MRDRWVAVGTYYIYPQSRGPDVPGHSRRAGADRGGRGRHRCSDPPVGRVLPVLDGLKCDRAAVERHELVAGPEPQRRPELDLVRDRRRVHRGRKRPPRALGRLAVEAAARGPRASRRDVQRCLVCPDPDLRACRFAPERAGVRVALVERRS